MNEEIKSINSNLIWNNEKNSEKKKRKRTPTNAAPQSKPHDGFYQKNKICDYFKNSQYETDPTPDELKIYGETHTTKATDVIRLWYTNPCGIGVNPYHIKSDESFSFLKSKSKCDVVGLAETNVHWRKLYGNASLYSRVKQRWRYFKISTSHNKHANLGKTQQGGTCTIAFGQAAYRATKMGEDPTGLGRWSWIEFRGRDEMLTRIYTAYRPGSKPSGDTQRTTVYHQHARYIRRNKLNAEPRQLFDNDIYLELKAQLTKSNVALMIDVNQDVVTGHFTQRMQKIGLINIIAEKIETTLPGTHHRGSKPISAIYTSPLLRATKVGILPIGLGVRGDHRNMFVDITTASLLGTYMYQIVSPPMKTLQLRDSRIVNRFNTQLRKHIEHNSMYSKGQQLMETSTYPIIPSQKLQIEEYDHQLGRGIAKAKRKCRTIKVGQIPFSDKFAHLRDTYRLWLLVRKKLLGQKISNTTIRRLSKRLEIHKPMTIPLMEATKLMYEASKEYQQFVKLNAREGRATFFEQLAAANALSTNQSKSKVLARIMREENQREQTVMNKKYFPKKGRQTQRVDRIQYQKGDRLVEVHTPRAVLAACQNDTKSKYSETDSTPLMEPTVHKRWGNFAETKYSSSFQNHKTELPDNIHTSMRTMLERTRHDYSIKRLPITMTSSEIKSAWNKVKEHKATSPSGRYNGIYKAMCLHDDLLEVLTYSMNLPFLTGSPYERWRDMIDIMAFKKDDNIQVSNVRSIIISEADWNTSGKVHVTHRLMKNAEQHNLLPQEHIGGRKGKKATDGVLAKRLLLDNARLLKRSMIIVSTDAANCYDRMTHKYISLVCIKWGLTAQVMTALLQPLQKAKHHTRTAYGDSTTYFEGRNLQGAGQGNTGAAPFWTSVSTPMIETMKTRQMHSKMITPLSGMLVILALLAFVDDTELFIMHPDDDDNKLIRRAQIALQLWKELLNITGGIMRPAKCSWTMMSYKPGSLKFKSIPEVPGSITLVNEKGNMETLSRYDHTHPREYLGVIQTTSGSEEAQLEKLRNSIIQWNAMIKNSRLPPVMNMEATLCKIHKTLTYPGAALTIPEEEYKKLSSKLYKITLPKCGIVRSFPITPRHLPHHYQGLHLPNLYLEQEISKVKELLNFATTKSIIGKQLQMGLETIQMNTGVRDIIYNYPYQDYQFLTPSTWLKSQWHFLSSNKYRLEGWNQKLEYQRQNDKCLMEEIVQMDTFSTEEIKKVNQCRLFLQVWSLADIVDGSGQNITQNIYNGYRDESRVSRLSWPSVKRPHYNSWLQWKKFLTSRFCTQEGTLKLSSPLGKWCKSHQKWQWYYSTHDNHIYRKMSGHVRQYAPININRGSRSGTQWFHIKSILTNDEIDLIGLERATVSKTSKGYTKVAVDGWAASMSMETSPGNNNDHLLHLLMKNGLPTWMATHGNLKDWTYSKSSWFLTQKLRLVTDGSYAEGKGAACVIIENEAQTDQMIFTTNVPSNLDNTMRKNDAYRSELFGLYAGLRVLYLMENIFSKQTSVTISCDNDRALQVTKEFSYVNTSSKHFDVIKSILHFRNKLYSTITYTPVIGHAEEKTPHRKLTRAEQLNGACDKIAKDARTELPSLNSVHLEGEGLSLWYGSSKIYCDVERTMRDIHGTITAERYISTKYSWTNEQFHSIDWESYRRSTKLLSPQHLIRIAKCVTKTLPIGRNMERRKQWNLPYCPRCREPMETVKHLMQCPHHDAQTIISKSIMELDEWMELVSTEPTLRQQLIQNILEWSTGDNGIITDPHHVQCILDQHAIGWDHLMQGRIHMSITQHMQKHYSDISSRKTGSSWTSVFIQKIWLLFFHRQWENRNQWVHALDKKVATSRETQNLQTSIRRQFTQENETSLMAQDRHLMEKPLSQLLKIPTAQKRAWLEDMQIATKYRDEVVEAENFQQSNFMSNYLQTFCHSRPARLAKINTHSNKKRRVSLRPRRPLLRAWEKCRNRKKKSKMQPKFKTLKKRVSTRRRPQMSRIWLQSCIIPDPAQNHRKRKLDKDSSFACHKKWAKHGTKEDLLRGSWLPP